MRLNRLLLTLLATTALAGIPRARADVLLESAVGGFGSAGSPTILSDLSRQVVGDMNAGNVGAHVDYFEVPGSSSGGLSMPFTLTFTAARAQAVVGSFAYLPLDYATQTVVTETQQDGSTIVTVLAGYVPNVGHSFEGGSGISVTSQFVGLPRSGGIFATQSYAPSSEGGSFMTIAVSAPNNDAGSSEGMSAFTIPAPELDPILSFYDDQGRLVGRIDITAGNYVEVIGTIDSTDSTDSSRNLNFSVSTPFDYVMSLSYGPAVVATTTDVPEPAGAAVLGLGVTALAAAKRRKRVI